MTDNIKQLQNRFSELAMRAERQCIWTHTDFLNMAEQDILLSMQLPVTLWGGYENAERRIGIFGDAEQLGYAYESDIRCIRIAPAMQKFAEPLTHRDILGALMSLGFDRKATGDILIAENIGYLFCLEPICAHILDNLTTVRHTAVRTSLCDSPAIFSEAPPRIALNVASERLDAVISAVYHLGRSAAKELFATERVFVNGRCTKNAGMNLPENCIVSVRGYGRFRYYGILRTTRKGRLSVEVSVY